MTLTYIIRETLLMMGFTFVVGVAFAYVLKLMTLFFSYLNGEDLPSLVRRSRIWGRAYRMEVAHSYRYIRSFVGARAFCAQNADGPCDGGGEAAALRQGPCCSSRRRPPCPLSETR